MLCPNWGCCLQVPTGALTDFAGFASYPIPAAECGKPAPPAPPLRYSGETFSVVKRSMLGPFMSTQNLTVDAAAGIYQQFRYTVAGSTANVDFVYPFMTMYNKGSTLWVAGTTVDGAAEYAGRFQHNASFTLYGSDGDLFIYSFPLF